MSLGRIEIIACRVASDAAEIEGICNLIHWPNWRTKAEAELELAEKKLADALAAVRRARADIRSVGLVAAE